MSQMTGFPSFLWLSNITLCVCSHFLYPFICWWTFTLFLYLGCYDQWCNKHKIAGVSTRSCLHFLWGYAQSEITGIYGSSILSWLRNLHTVLYSGCTNLHSHQQCTRGSFLSHPKQHLLILFHASHSTGMRW